MTVDKKHICKEALKILGREKVKQLYELFGSEKIPIASLNKLVLKEEFFELFDGKKSISQIAKELKVSKMTLYRTLRDNKQIRKS